MNEVKPNRRALLLPVPEDKSIYIGVLEFTRTQMNGLSDFTRTQVNGLSVFMKTQVKGRVRS